MVYSYEFMFEEEKSFRLNTAILTKVKVKSINDAALPDIALNKFRGYTIRFGAIYVLDVKHDEIMETIFSRGGLNYDEFMLGG